MLEAAVLLPLAFSAMLNLIYFGSSVMLWRTLLFYAVHMTVTALAGFSVAAQSPSAWEPQANRYCSRSHS